MLKSTKHVGLSILELENIPKNNYKATSTFDAPCSTESIFDVSSKGFSRLGCVVYSSTRINLGDQNQNHSGTRF